MMTKTTATSTIEESPAGVAPIAKPFVRWAGGKGKIANDLAALVPPYVGRRADRRYLEPFAGGAALFFALAAASSDAPGGVDMRHVVLSDANEALMFAFYDVRTYVDRTIEELRAHVRAHVANGKLHYYATREHWNEKRSTTSGDFLYLNRACFNGLWRVAKNGKMNTPAGDRVIKPEDIERDNALCDETNLRACALALAGVTLKSGDYTDAVKDVRAGDFVYFDPPYDGTFAGYTADGFDADSQRELAFVAREIVKAGARVMISNSDTELVREIYGSLAGCEDFKLGTLATRHTMAAAGEKRKNVHELVICGGGVRDWKQTNLLL